MGVRPVLVIALGWAVVVSVVATVTFVVIDRAGRGVGQASGTMAIAPRPAATASTDRSATPSVRPTPRPTPTPSPTPTTTARPRATVAEPAALVSSPAKHPPAARQAETRAESFTTEGGVVVASCAGTELTLDSITPRDGWSFETASEEGVLEVHFKPRQEDVDEVEITIGCLRGTPSRHGD